MAKSDMGLTESEIEMLYEDIIKNALPKFADNITSYAKSELEDFVAEYTGHKNLSKSIELKAQVIGPLAIKLIGSSDATKLSRSFKSNSSLHKEGEPWKIAPTSNISAIDYFHAKKNGDIGGQYGALDLEWVLDNFWFGIETWTNGWPRTGGNSKLLFTKHNVPSAHKALDLFVDRYENNGMLDKHLDMAIQ